MPLVTLKTTGFELRHCRMKQQLRVTEGPVGMKNLTRVRLEETKLTSLV